MCGYIKINNTTSKHTDLSPRFLYIHHVVTTVTQVTESGVILKLTVSIIGCFSVPSQVIVGRTLAKKQMLMSVATKIAIQLNCKLGGEVWAVEIPVSFTFISVLVRSV